MGEVKLLKELSYLRTQYFFAIIRGNREILLTEAEVDQLSIKNDELKRIKAKEKNEK